MDNLCGGLASVKNEAGGSGSDWQLSNQPLWRNDFFHARDTDVVGREFHWCSPRRRRNATAKIERKAYRAGEDAQALFPSPFPAGAGVLGALEDPCPPALNKGLA